MLSWKIILKLGYNDHGSVIAMTLNSKLIILICYWKPFFFSLIQMLEYKMALSMTLRSMTSSDYKCKSSETQENTYDNVK